ncbi:Xaa-Pro aminopeptidase [Gayadomonas joobiniege]|uniref:Xaa-Pro aminopeptidase n=1 Tax=Gayadomonas joobiniege TaxID=1234606 RepID=UPI00035C2F20|nr:Xaa-Pro aminopeptidase [Gayadomonas joobiniege]
MITLQEYVARREAVFAQMLPNSLAVVAAADEAKRSRDTEYPFRQDSDFYYLTGFNEPEAILVLVNLGQSQQSVLFCRTKDALAEIWQGRRLGPDAAVDQLAVTQAYPIEAFATEFAGLNKGCDTLYWSHANEALTDKLQALLKVQRQTGKHAQVPSQWIDLCPMLHEMRLFKSAAEISVMQKAADISVDAHKRAMKFVQPGCYEYQLEAELKHEFAMQGARFEAYASIVAGGANACILHYTENNQILNDGDLVLIDAGCEYQGYAADITRTFPVNGCFSEAQKKVYQLVLDAQTAALAALGPGKKLTDAQDICIRVLSQGLLELGILSGSLEDIIQERDGQPPAYRQFFMHGLGHWLGLDVHDVGNYQQNGEARLLAPGMVLTVEPGLYISEQADVDDCWKGIGVRIEDNIVITDDGHRVLTAAVPKTITAIEQWMKSS